jgi:hypothetical protein
MPLPFQIIDGSNAAVDISIAAASHKCWASYWSADIVRDFTEKTTFCTSGWRSRQPGLKQLIGTIDGFLPEGLTAGTSTAISPASYFASTASQAYILTADAGCTFTFQGHAGREHTGIRAALNSEWALNFESDGQVTTAWVVT